ncbi:MAG TPA: hypothetical protein VFH68_12990 [Polyangia bacterium]|nr:hypothetical protein [Polyangia bacterium]
MRLKFAPVALVVIAPSVVFGLFCALGAPANAWAKGGKGNSDKNADVPEGFNRQFKWEESVVGKNEKKLDHQKIAAMQAAARKEDAAHKNQPTVKKTERPQGVGVPASSTLPTMDIEKAAPAGTVKQYKPRPVAVEPARRRDSLDQLLDSEKDTSSARPRRDGGLGKVLAISDNSPARTTVANASAHDTHASKARNKHARRR